MLIDLSDITPCITKDNHNPYLSAEKIFSASTDKSSSLPLLPTNSISIATHQLNTLQLSPESVSNHEIEDSYLERSDISNYYHFRRKKNIEAWKRSHKKLLTSHTNN